MFFTLVSKNVLKDRKRQVIEPQNLLNPKPLVIRDK
ncbi:hypothetical protein ABIE50_004076 [Chitinophaga sp. OAE865]